MIVEECYKTINLDCNLLLAIMAVNEDFLLYIQDQLAGVAPTESKKMFGGIGFFKDGLMFGMIANNIFRLKMGPANLPDFKSFGMEPMYSKDKKSSLPYYQVPTEVLEDQTQLTFWAQKAIQIALDAAKKK